MNTFKFLLVIIIIFVVFHYIFSWIIENLFTSYMIAKTDGSYLVTVEPFMTEHTERLYYTVSFGDELGVFYCKVTSPAKVKLYKIVSSVVYRLFTLGLKDTEKLKKIGNRLLYKVKECDYIDKSTIAYFNRLAILSFYCTDLDVLLDSISGKITI